MTEANLNGRDILVADSNPHIVTLVREVLRGAHARQVYETKDTAAALSIIRKNPVSGIIVSLRMEPIDGIDFTRLVRNIDDRVIRRTPIVMLAATSKTTDICRARDIGVDEIVTKPLCANTLLTRLCSSIIKPRTFVTEPGYVGPERRTPIVQENRAGSERRHRQA